MRKKLRRNFQEEAVNKRNLRNEKDSLGFYHFKKNTIAGKG